MNFVWRTVLLTIFLSNLAAQAATSAEPNKTADPDKSKAIQFLDGAGAHWAQTKQCTACHTGWAYPFARIGTPGWEQSPVQLFEKYIQDRQANWATNKPFYGTAGTEKGTESAGSEAVTEVSLLTEMDRARGLTSPPPLTQTALQHMMELQQPDGAFPWLDYAREPFESKDSRVFGAVMARIALGRVNAYAASHYADGYQRLTRYLAAAYASPATPLYFKLAVVWSASESGSAVPATETNIQKLIALQNPDGGWSIDTLNTWKKLGPFPYSAVGVSDGNGTSFAFMVLTSVAGAKPNPAAAAAIQKARTWLAANQNADGSWGGDSVNFADQEHEQLEFNAATAFALRGLDNDRTGVAAK